MANSIYEIWISTNDNKDRLRLPILPESFHVSSGSRNESADISSLGEITIIQEPGVKTFQFSSFFPKKYIPLADYTNVPNPLEAVKRIEKWRKSKKVLRLIVTKTNINFPVTIESFNYREMGGAVGDIYFDLTFKEYTFIKVRTIKVKIAQPKAKSSRPSTKSSSKTHTVKRGDTLWALARKYYGNGAQWNKIWNVKSNKDMLIKRDSRNRKQPGHWIYPGQVLTIP